ncbi:MAG: protein kinase, partial [Deltaproteobacteria bacterium]|nr:protein kinase [Deltaproteobacteria bacterium]
MDLIPSEQILKIKKRIASGGMGEVYEAHSNLLGIVAVKILKQDSEKDLSFLESELRVLSQLKHPNLVQVYGFSRDGTPLVGVEARPCFWMERVQGKPILEAASTVDSSVKKKWFYQSLEALRYLHQQGVIHSDLKPANLLIDAQRQVKIIDFGMARLKRSLGKNIEKIQGTLPYLAPEVIEGQPGFASDLFSLGTLFYQLFSGHHPRQHAKKISDFFQPLSENLSDYCPDLSSVEIRILQKMIEPSLTHRFQSADEVLEVLHHQSFQEEATHVFHSFEMIGHEKTKEDFFHFLNQIESEKKQGIVYIQGARGVGKTRLIRELSFELLLKNYTLSSKYEASSFLFPIYFLEHLETQELHSLKKVYSFIKSSSFCSGLFIIEFQEEEITEAHQNFLDSLQNSFSILHLKLKNFSFEQTQLFLNRVLSSPLDSLLVREIFQKTHGNPSSVIDLLESLHDLDFFKKNHHSFEIIQNIQEPKSIEETLRRRLNRLSKMERSLLMWMQLTSQEISLSHLKNLTGSSFLDLSQQLQTLISYHFIFEDERATDRFYRLAHPQMINKIFPLNSSDIQKMHRRAIELLEEKRDLTLSEKISKLEHQLALNLYPELMKSLIQVSEHFINSKNDSEAIYLFDACLQKELSPYDREWVLRQLANTYSRMEKFEEAVQVTEQWFQEFPEDEFKIHPLKYYLSTGIAFRNLGYLSESIERLQLCVNKCDLSQSEHLFFYVRAHSLLGLSSLENNQLEDAKKHFDAAEPYLNSNHQQSAEFYKHRAMLAGKEFKWDEVLFYFEKAEKIYRDIEYAKGILSVALERGNLALVFQQVDEAEKAYAEALKQAIRAQDEASLGKIYQNLGVLFSKRGFYLKALDALEKAKEIFIFYGNTFERAMNHLQLSWVHACLGQFEKSDYYINLCPCAESSLPSIETRKEEVLKYRYWLEKGLDAKLHSTEWIEKKLHEKNPDWDLDENLLKWFLKEPPAFESIQKTLYEIHQSLPLSYQITFEERFDYQKSILNLKNDSLSFLENQESSMFEALQKLNRITQELLSSTDMDQILNKLMDAAMELSKAERGFLVIQNPMIEKPLPGYEIKVSRNIKESLLKDTPISFSVSAIQQAMQTRKVLLTD